MFTFTIEQTFRISTISAVQPLINRRVDVECGTVHFIMESRIRCMKLSRSVPYLHITITQSVCCLRIYWSCD
jgi:hypothetical protein